MIPEAAVEAAWFAQRGTDVSRADLRLILEAAAPHMLAEAWDAGRESFAKDLLSPLSEIGTRKSSANPYRPTP